MQTNLISLEYKKALDLVAVLFRDINRKLGDVPYLVHLVGVSHILQKVTDDKDVITAGLLHDVLEDIPAEKYSEEQMRKDFGDRITDIVKTVSHDEESYGLVESRRKYLDQIKVGPLDACLVSAADLLYNAQDIILEFNRSYEDSVRVFGGKKAELRQWFWSERINIFEQRLGSDHPLVLELQPVFAQVTDINQKIK